VITGTPTAVQRQLLTGASFGLYAAVVALVPGLAVKAALCVPLLAIPLGWWVLQTPRRWLALFFLMALLLPPLPFAIGNSGPHVALLAAGAGLWVGLLRIREWRWEADTLTIATLVLFAIFLGSVAMAALYSGYAIAVGSFARVLLFGISVYVFLYLRHGPGAASRVESFALIQVMFWAAVASALFACVDFYYQLPAPAGYGPQFISLESGVFRRAQGFFYEASTLGNVCVFFLEMIAVAALLRRRERPVPLLALIAGGIVLASALALSYSRGSLVSLTVALAVLTWLERRRIRLGRLLVGIALVAGTVAVLSIAVPVFANIYWLRILSSVQYFVESPDAVLSGRLQNWALLRDFLLAHPWYALLGVGYKTLPYSDVIGTTVIADNAYLSALVETGVFGLAAVIGLNAAILVAAYRASKAGGRRAFFGTWMFCFWVGQSVQMFSVDLLTFWRVLPLYLCVLALATRKEPGAHPVS
jgi:O-antigen ligase